ncbi:Alpha/Beta hydrolase protein [Mycena sanguinolenta]|nr:Alpha/Beta hydrolase protein [Mycena sanguinolenta]
MILSAILAIYPLLGFAVSTGAASPGPTVSLDYGTFLGINDGNLTKFLGVPFSAPTARFELPRRLARLEGLQNFPVPPVVSEDCLNLNVFTPATKDTHRKFPVLVFIYGGGFESGTSFGTDFRPAVERSILIGEPVIIVTPNYRLSAYGFLAGKEVEEADLTNLGLRDQIAALKWVQRHIHAFGGDPDRVVLQVHSFSFTYDQLVAANNCTKARNTLDCLRKVPLDDFRATVNQTPDFFSYKALDLAWSPRVDGDIVPKSPIEMVQNGEFMKVPVMVGNCDDEGTLFSYPSVNNVTTDSEFVDYIRYNYLPNATSAQLARVAELYPQDPAQGSPFGTGSANQLTPEFKRNAAFQGDLILTGLRRFFAQHTSKTQNTWSWLSKRGKSTPYLGTYHTSDMALWFPANITNAADTVAVDALINFINTLDPNVSAAPRLPITALIGPTVVNITADDFRVQEMEYLISLHLDGVTVYGS